MTISTPFLFANTPYSKSELETDRQAVETSLSPARTHNTPSVQRDVFTTTKRNETRQSEKNESKDM